MCLYLASYLFAKAILKALDEHFANKINNHFKNRKNDKNIQKN